MVIKILKQNLEQFAPVTVAEAVVVNHSTGVKRLDEVLKFKIEGVITPAGSGLTSSRTDNAVIISHANNINPSVDELKPKLIKYDNHGHIIETGDFGKFIVTLQGGNYMEYDGSSTKYVHLGDDFMDNNGYIQIQWNNLA